MSKPTTTGTATCARCGEARWPTTPQTPYTCQRCREVLLAGRRCVVDPLPSAAQQQARDEAGRRLRRLPFLANRHGAETGGQP